MTPLFESPCDFAKRMPTFVADFLELESRIGRRFREDSVTDFIIASLLKLGGHNATVLVPPEPITGSDFDMLIVDPASEDAIQYRIQAKRLVPHVNQWEWSSYRELDHPHGTGGQASTLMRSSAQERIPTIPLYAFYNPQMVCAASNMSVDGISLADGRQVNAIIRALVKAKMLGKRPRWKRLSNLRHLFFPLHTILCAGTENQTNGSWLLSPSQSRLAVEEEIRASSRRQPDVDDPPPRLRSAAENMPLMASADLQPTDAAVNVIPSSGSSITHAVSTGSYPVGSPKLPRVVRRAIERKQDDSPIIKTRGVKRPKLVLLNRP